jgi:Leucine-rich repeat (LRR) protein
MNMKKLHLFTLAIGLLSCVGAEAQNASGAQPLPKPKPPVRQSAPNPGSSRNPNTPPAPGQANPKAVGLKPGAPAGKLLDSIALSKEPYFTDLQEAAKNPTKVYKLVLSGDNNIPNGLEKYSNLQYLEINGPAPQRPMMPGQRADMPDDVPPPPMPMAPPAIPNGKGSEIGAGLLSLGNLTELHLHNLGIKEIPFEISKLTNLKVLDLNGNPVNKFPESISTIKGLKAFYVNDGMAQTLPASMTSMTNLTILETGINSIPEIKSLRELILNNRNPNLPAGIEKLVNLRKIVILSSMMPNNSAVRCLTSNSITSPLSE